MVVLLLEVAPVEGEVGILEFCAAASSCDQYLKS